MGKIVETSRGFETAAIPLDGRTFKEEDLLKAFRAGAAYLKRQGSETLRIHSYWEDATARYTPMNPDAIFISPYFARKNMEYFILQNGDLNDESFSKEIMTVLAHERVHREQLFSDPTLGAQARRMAQSLRWLEAEVGDEALTLRELNPEQVKERLSGLFSTLQGHDPELTSSLRAELGKGRLALDFLSQRSQSSHVRPSELLDLLLTRSLLTWTEKPSHQALLGIQSRWILRNWKIRYEFFVGQGTTRSLEDEAYRVENIVRIQGRGRPATYVVFSQSYEGGLISHSTDYKTLAPEGLETMRQDRLLQGVLNFADHRYVVGSLRGLGAVGNSLFFLDGSHFVNSVQDPGQSASDVALSGTTFLSSSTAGISGNVALFTGNLALKSAALRIAGPAGAGAAFLASTHRLIDDAERAEVGGAEISFSALDVAANAVMLGATIALVVGSGGTLLPVLLIAGGIATSVSSQTAHAELTENRVADSLAEALLQFADSPGSPQADRIGELLQDPHHELDDDALMDFFTEHVDTTPTLQSSALWKHPLLKPLRERILEELGGEDFFAYQGDEEGAYRMFIALHDSPETAQRVSSELDASDREELEALLRRYRLDPKEIHRH